MDGWESDWIGVEESKFDGLTLRAVNDGEALYVCLSTDSAYLKHQLTGPRPWSLSFRPGKTEAGEWGLRFEHLLPREVQAFVTGLDPLGLGRRLRAESDGLDLAEHESNGRLVVELKVPLRAETEATVVLGAAPGDEIKVGLVLPQGAFSGRPAGAPANLGGRQGPPGGPGGGFGGPPSGGPPGGGPPGGMPPREEAREASADAVLWGTLKLASAP